MDTRKVNAKRKLIIPMLLPLMSATAIGSTLPDEINYTPYERQYQQYSNEVDVITNNLEDTKSDLSYQYNLEANYLNDIGKLKSENLDLYNQIQSNEDRRDELVSRSEDLLSQLNSLQRRINSTESDRNQVERSIIREERRLVPYQNKVAQLENRLHKQDVLVRNADNNLRKAEKLSSSLRSQLKSLNTERTSIKNALAKLETRLANLDNSIKAQKAKLKGLPAKIKNTSNKLAASKQKLSTLTTELKALQTELADLMRTDRADPRVRELRGQVAVKAKAKNQESSNVSKLQSNLNALKSSEASIKREISKLESSKNTLPGQISKMQANLKTKKRLIETKKVEVGNAEQMTAQKRIQLDKVAAESSRIQNSLNKAQRNLVAESRTLNNLIGELRDLNSEVSRLNSDYNSVSNNYNLVENEISSIDNRIPQLNNQIASNDRTLAKLDNDLFNTQNKIVALSDSITELESQQNSAITKRDIKYQEYISRYDYYNEKLAEAKALGESQSDSALAIAVTDSNIYVGNRSSQLASMMGEKLGNAQASLWSAVRSEIKGYEDGYNAGYASTPDQSRGESEGTLAGINAANDYANQVLKPQFFNQYFAERLGNTTANFLPNLADAPDTLVDIDNQLNLIDILGTVSPITSAEMNESLNTNTNLDSVISKLNISLKNTLTEKVSLGKAQNAYQSPQSIPTGAPNCNSVYKALSVFKSACSSEYKATFKTKYTSEYFANFEAQYSNMYEDTLSPIRLETLENSYQINFDKYYPVAFNSGEAVGKAEIYRQAFEAAKVSAYNSELPQASTRAESAAKQEVVNYIATNATLKVTGAKLGDSDLQGGSRVKLELKLKNISPKDLVNPVKIQITEAKNIELSQNTYLVKIAKGNTVTVYGKINGTIKGSVRSNTQIKLAGKVILPGGKYESQRTESFSATATTALNPQPSISYKYLSSPNVLTRWRRRIIIQNFDATITPAIESLKAGYTITMAAASGYEKMIKFKNTSVSTNRLNYGQSAKAQFKYTFPSSSRGKTVVIQLSYSYKGKIVKTEKITLKPQ